MLGKFAPLDERDAGAFEIPRRNYVVIARHIPLGHRLALDAKASAPRSAERHRDAQTRGADAWHCLNSLDKLLIEQSPLLFRISTASNIDWHQEDFAYV